MEEVGSSSSRMGGSLITARAIATPWRWPPESDSPRSPTSISKPCGCWLTKSTMPLRVAALSTSASSANGAPRVMFSRRLP